MAACPDDEAETGAYVEIAGGNCYIRSHPEISGAILGTAYRGEKLNWLGETSENGWHKIRRGETEGYVSGKYAQRTDDQ